jgi:Carbohydrate binding module (family 6)
MLIKFSALTFLAIVLPVLAEHGGGILGEHDEKSAVLMRGLQSDGSAGAMSATFVVTWLSKLKGVVNRDRPTVTASCPDDGLIELVQTSSDDVNCTKISPQVLECTSGESVFSDTDLLDLEDGVNVTFSCSGSSEAALMPSFDIAEQTFQANVVGIYTEENIVTGSSEPQMEAYQVCGDDLVRTDWCSPLADTLFGYCEASASCNAVCYGIGCTDTCSFTVPPLATGVTSVSCKETSVASIECQVPASSVPMVFQAEEASNLYEYDQNTPLPGNETCCFTTANTQSTAWQDGFVSLPEAADMTSDMVVSYFDEGDYLSFGPVDFGPESNCASVRVRYSRGDETHVHTGAYAKFEPTQEIAGILFRLDSPTGPLVGEFLAPHTGGYDIYEVGEAAVSASGEHTLHVVGQGGRGVMNLDWIEMSPGISTTSPSTPSPTNAPTSALTPATNSPTVAASTEISAISTTSISQSTGSPTEARNSIQTTEAPSAEGNGSFDSATSPSTSTVSENPAPSAGVAFYSMSAFFLCFHSLIVHSLSSLM